MSRKKSSNVNGSKRSNGRNSRSSTSSDRNSDNNKSTRINSGRSKAGGPASKGKLSLTALNNEQKLVLDTINKNVITFIYGSAGSGKSYLAAINGLLELEKGNYDKLIFTRPCIEAYGEKLGSLPGDANEKVAPYMAPLFNILSEKKTQTQINKLIDTNKITTLPLAYTRGITFHKSYVVADEFQNARIEQVRLLLTRIGKDSKIIVTGDVQQSDLSVDNGLQDAITRIANVKDIGIVKMNSSFIRHPVISVIEKKYNEEK